MDALQVLELEEADGRGNHHGGQRAAGQVGQQVRRHHQQQGDGERADDAGDLGLRAGGLGDRRARGTAADREAMVVFINEADRSDRGLHPGARVALETFSDDGIQRRVEGLTLVDYPMSRGSIAGYFPELNPLLPLGNYDRTSGTPAAKSIPVRVVAC